MNETFPSEENNVIPIERGHELQKRKAIKLQKLVLHHIQGVEVYRDNLQEKKANALKQGHGLEISGLFQKIQNINKHITDGRILLDDGNDVRAMAEYLQSEWRQDAEQKKVR